MSTPVNNGQATIPINTTGLTEGQYKIEVSYTDGNYYNNTSVENSILTLDAWNIIDTTTNTRWEYNTYRTGNITPTWDNNGTHSGKYNDVYNTTPLPTNCKIKVKGTYTNNNSGIMVLWMNNTNDNSFVGIVYDNGWKLRVKTNGTRVLNQSINTVPSDFEFETTIQNNTITIKYGTNTYTVNLNDYNFSASSFYFDIYNENTGEIVIKELKYKEMII